MESLRTGGAAGKFTCVMAWNLHHCRYFNSKMLLQPLCSSWPSQPLVFFSDNQYSFPVFLNRFFWRKSSRQMIFLDPFCSHTHTHIHAHTHTHTHAHTRTYTHSNKHIDTRKQMPKSSVIVYLTREWNKSNHRSYRFPCEWIQTSRYY